MSAAAVASRVEVREAAMVHATTVIALAVRGDGIAVLTVNDPREPVNTLTRELGEELAAPSSASTADAAIKGAVIASAKKDFVVGANIDMLKAVKLAVGRRGDGARAWRELLGKIADAEEALRRGGARRGARRRLRDRARVPRHRR